ncbi:MULTISPECIES: dihydrofolate reductase family protein [unclassified Mucilaginibacter]|uniref:dihydrofolate reductase family protein n=1 Tax=unclassified Mucilaginibacter TaxID=2617802 RepID=UPI000965D94B|nr:MULTISPECIES: dihydrofolate reductase family protein [unclassified Mucilaginibacter]OJW18592.1 MAG: dihydrofolate reductase [Mucilaginibacter sp. 44-25]PLW88993.1 MAG: dihydrofolate reductase [Mucilaginibacter sp.]PMP66138.1 MAG: dihydrofolate reductase [Mucilaginibacter sp.]HEK21248.1 dihydrofolate reductase [Bacteroidota bacterium]
MRKIIISAFVTLDGIMQAPGGPDEDREGGFAYGGWSAPYSDEISGEAMQKQMQPADLLLGRKTFDIFESYWPQHTDHWPGINEVTKYVLSTTRESSDWKNTMFINTVEDILKIKETEGGHIVVWGSSQLVHLLLKHNLADELWLKIYPVVLGKGKKLFNDEISASAFTLAESTVTPGGVIFANYIRAGEVKTGTIGA